LAVPVSTLSGLPSAVDTPLGRRVVLTEEYWLHIGLRHPEVGVDPTAVLQTVRNPEEIYQDRVGSLHLLRRVDEGHFMVVICRFVDHEGFITTAYLTNLKRKNRRYRESRPLKRY